MHLCLDHTSLTLATCAACLSIATTPSLLSAPRRQALRPRPTQTIRLAPCAPCRLPWQRIFALQIVRSVAADPQLLAQLFTASDMCIHAELNAVQDVVALAVDTVKVRAAGCVRGAGLPPQAFHRCLQALTCPCALPTHHPPTMCFHPSPPPTHTQAFMRQAAERPDDEMFEALSSYYRARSDGKDAMPEGDALGEMLRQGDVSGLLPLHCIVAACLLPLRCLSAA